MQSIISMISVNNNLDVAPLDDLEDIPDIESLSGDISEHVLDFTQQLEQLTSSLTGSELPTPISGELLLFLLRLSLDLVAQSGDGLVVLASGYPRSRNQK